MNGMGSAIRAAVPVLAMTFAAGAAAGQAPMLVTGHAIELETELALPGVEVELLDLSERRIASAVTDSTGWFRLESTQPGFYHVRASFIGYRTVITPVPAMAAGDTIEVLLRLSVDAVALDPLEVVARAVPRHPGLARFHERAERRMGGRFVLREDIETGPQRAVSDVLTMMGLRSVGNPLGRGALFMNRSGCAPTVFLDGVKIAHSRSPAEAFDAVNLLPPSSVEGIEVYPGAASVPAEFAGSDAGCGVVAIWSRRGLAR